MIARLSLRILAYTLAPRRTENLSSTSIHVSSEIQLFILLFLACGFGTALLRDAKVPSSLVGLTGGQSGSFLHPERYLVCSLSGALLRHPNTM